MQKEPYDDCPGMALTHDSCRVLAAGNGAAVSGENNMLTLLLSMAL